VLRNSYRFQNRAEAQDSPSCAGAWDCAEKVDRPELDETAIS
jgi:hypothetical protein